MESLGAFPEGDWDFINRLLFTEEGDSSMQFLFPNDFTKGLSFNDEANPNNPFIDNKIFFSSENLNFNHNLVSNNSFCSSDNRNNMFVSNHIPVTNTICSDISVFNDDTMKEMVCIEESQLKRKSEVTELVIHESRKKRSRASNDVQINKKTAVAKKRPNLVNNGNDNEETNAAQIMQVSSGSTSEDDSNASDPKASTTLNLNGKTRAIRGSATDAQSLYARKRREKINERLKSLQNLVPNGNKVDLSTMLEEAVHYVKFLQLQIKLLSSDDLWMYAPMAYNGTDVNLLQAISPTS